MIELQRIHHIGMAVTDIDAPLALFEGLFGFERASDVEDAASGVRRVMLRVPGRGNLGWELATPLRDDSSLASFLAGPTGPGVHHVAIDVPDASAAATALRNADLSALAQDDRVILEAEQARGLNFHFREPGMRIALDGAAPADRDATLGVIGIDHVCHACPDRDEYRDWYGALFGMTETHRTPDGKHEDLADLVMDVPGGQMRWEVLQPVGEGSFVERFLERRGPSVHHVAFEVRDWERAMAACEQHDVPTFDDNSGTTDGAAWRDTFIHPRYTGGVLLQLFWEERPDAWVASDKVASGPGAGGGR